MTPAQIRARLGVKHPLAAQLHVVDRCNHHCVHCHQVHGRTGEMPLSEIETVLDNLARAGVLFLTITGGEPTLRPDFIDILRAARERGFALRLFTNGYAIDRSLAQRLIDVSGVEVHVSLYSHIGPEHDSVTGVGGSWNRTTAAIQAMTELGIPCVVKWTGMATSTATVEDMAILAKKLGTRAAPAVRIMRREDGSDVPAKARMESGQMLKAFEQSEALREARAGDDPHSHPCSMCQETLLIDCAGQLRLCVNLPWVLGDARKDELTQLMRTEQATFAASITWNHIHGCRDCDLRKYCRRCHAEAYLEGGDLLGPYPSACEETRVRTSVLLGQRIGFDLSNGANRNPPVGPFRLDGAIAHAIEDRILAEDSELITRHPWIRVSH